MTPANLLFILCDEHNPRVLGANGHPLVQTPNLDRLAASGVNFTDAYTNSPICVPARAALATGRYVHQIRFWDNAIAYDGSVPSWHHRLRTAGHEVVAIGKLHFRSADDDNGFSREVMPLHSSTGSATRSAGCATRCRCARRRCVSRTRRDAATRPISITTTRSPRQRSIG